MLTQQMR